MYKYKLINKNTGDETICEKVTIDEFEYYVSDDVIPDEHYYISLETNYATEPKERFILYVKSSGLNGHNPRLVIACTNPNVGIPNVVDDVEIEELAWEEAKSKFAKEEGREPNINNEKDSFVVGILQEGIIHGYNKSQETYTFSKKDMIEFGKYCIRQFALFRNMDDDFTKRLLPEWKEQKIKIIYYE